MSWRLQVCCVVAAAVFGGVVVVLTSGVVHEAVQYGVAILTGGFLGLGLAKR